MSKTRDAAKLARTLRRIPGVVVEQRGHYKVFRDGHLTTTFPVSPSDGRWILNTKANLRRAGINV